MAWVRTDYGIYERRIKGQATHRAVCISQNKNGFGVNEWRLTDLRSGQTFRKDSLVDCKKATAHT